MKKVNSLFKPKFKMRLFILLLFFSQICYCQSKSAKDNFVLKGSVVGRDTGRIVLNYYDKNNKGVFDTTVIKNGEFEFSGTVNKVSDANLWTDLKNINFSDKSVIRFLLEPKSITISYTEGLATDAIIKGSKTQLEWELWEKEKANFIINKDNYQKKADSLYLLAKSDTTQLKNLKSLVNQLDSVKFITRIADLNYIKQHPNSYLSGFLLYRYSRRLPIDSLEIYYNLLSKKVKRSNVAYTVLDYVFPLSNNILFKKSNPLNGVKFNKKLFKIKSIYDLSSKDTSGNKISFKKFTGNYILIDFWASWCNPCIADVPYLKKVMEEYKNDSIKFISVSLDTDEKRWKTAVLKNNLYWEQVSDLKGFNGFLPTYCKIVKGIPQYVLIDKNGLIINGDTPRPEEPELRILLKKLLGK